MAGRVHSKLRKLNWKHGTVSVSAFGGMIGPCSFKLPSGVMVDPFHSAPWLEEINTTELSGLLAGLRGEWPCVPFGYPMKPNDECEHWPEGWPGEVEEAAQEADVHGYSSAAIWSFGDVSETEISLFVDYPEDHAIRRLKRVVRPDPKAAALDIELTVYARRETCEPVGLHGCFRLPTKAGMARLEPGNFALGRSHPLTIEPVAPIFAPASTFEQLNAVRAVAGKNLDASCIPFEANGEDLLQLDGVDGHFAMALLDEGYRLTFDWDADVLPSVLLWYSNRGRDAAPWRNRHLCIGIEPICSPFGLSPDMARANNPISASGTPTCVTLTPETPLTIPYRIGVKDIK